MEWSEGVKSELDFWGEWYKTKGLFWPDDYLFRLDADTEIQENISVHLVTGNERILDVGAGPLTVLGKKWKGKALTITACDALADAYAVMNEIYNITPLIVTEKCRAERLCQKYNFSVFDLVHAQNCIDHFEDPLRAIIEMISTVKRGGKVIMRHEVNEGENEGYGGFHQWNFYADEGSFIISGKGHCNNVNQVLGRHAKIFTTVEGGYIENIIHRV